MESRELMTESRNEIREMVTSDKRALFLWANEWSVKGKDEN